MRLLRTGSVLGAATLALLALAGMAGADTGDTVRGGGVELVLPDGWSRVQPVRQSPTDDPRTVLVIGTDGVHAIDTDFQVSSYHVPVDGAAVVVIGWRDSLGVSQFLPLSGLKLRRGTFECFPGRGAVAQVARRGYDYQVNVMVGDRASAETIDAALDAARSISARHHD
jgi:hypothetical protein